MKIAALNKKVLSLKGNVRDFLKGISSNTAERHQNSFLDKRGNIVVTFEQVWMNDDVLLILIEAPFIERLTRHIDKYLFLSDTLLTEEKSYVYYDLDDRYPYEADTLVIPQKKGRLLVTKMKLTTSVSEDDFTLFRVENGIPVQGIDYDKEMLLNINDDRYVSFEKGCFLGQEILARVRTRAKPPRKLIVCEVNQCTPLEAKTMTSKVFSPRSGRQMGFTFVVN